MGNHTVDAALPESGDLSNGAPTSAARSAPPRRLPLLNRETEAFWTGGSEGRLMICRCEACGRYLHPPLPRCPPCGGQTAPSPVSGKGRVASFTINVQAWTPGLQVPFVFAAVELVEQAELYVFTNIIDCPAREVRIGMSVEVAFEPHGDVWLPLFRPQGQADAG